METEIFSFLKYSFNKKYLNQSNTIVCYSKNASLIMPLILSCFNINYVLDTRSDLSSIKFILDYKCDA